MAPYNESLGYSEISKNDLSNILKINMYAESDSSILYYILNDFRVSYFNAYMKPVQKQTTTSVMTVNESFQNGGLGTVTSGIMDRTAGNVTADYGVKRVVENAGRLNGGLIGGGSGGLIGGGSGGLIGGGSGGSGDNGIPTLLKPGTDFGNITFGGEGSGNKIKEHKPQVKIKVDANYIYDKAKKLVDAMIEEYNGSSDCNSIVKNGTKYDTYGDDISVRTYYTNFKDVLTVYIFNFSFMYSKFIEGKLGDSDKNILNLYKQNFIVNWDGINLYSFNLAIKSIVEKLFNSKSYQLKNILLHGEKYNNNDNFLRFMCDLAYNYDILAKYKEYQCSRINLFGHQEPGNDTDDLFP